MAHRLELSEGEWAHSPSLLPPQPTRGTCYGWVKAVRGVATRFQKLAIHYLRLRYSAASSHPHRWCAGPLAALVDAGATLRDHVGAPARYRQGARVLAVTEYTWPIACRP